MAPFKRAGEHPRAARGERRAGRPPGAAGGVPRWSAAPAEAHPRPPELFGVRFGLEKMRRMMTALGSPQRRLASIHIPGPNGKTAPPPLTPAVLPRHRPP